ncbi:DUF5682 family protein [Tuwongella immobilis]|uniref:Uncharacterized protein n=1 Tax=Tuwongella immobilis TaxID=692036 RepID=A0A6C2YP12_9BACT|nr:DUF5682 family protein [Tuwongella immobilis]VIP03360.1 Uncharacterized protein OS=Tolypothrix bouteillei VB521301 GN=DA73_45930 PE=4 SV=1 [Tuwongella immobilis]VTS04092.1 Uncharacterized protein OS=Tolypothrix bouteillei VB521301 GN=DA73_45930 PE=4 SV=1 [Tuwongella immobilis]
MSPSKSPPNAAPPSANPPLPGVDAPLRQQLLDAAKQFGGGEDALSKIWAGILDDVDRLMHERLEIFPVCHHSPASAVHLVQRLRRQPPRVIFMEMCEDFRPLCEKLRDCRLPVAFQAFAGASQAFPASWTPLAVVAPLTEFSAEYQAIVYAMERPTTELVFVDRSVDLLFQWMPQKEDELEKHLGKETGEGEAPDPGEGEAEGPSSHGTAVGIQIGEIEPTFEQFREFLLQNAQVRYFSEWWEQYVEQAIIGRDYVTYRQVMALVGSLLRKLGRKDDDLESDRKRERFMWTRMKEYLREHAIAPEDALYICGAAHIASDVPEFGTRTDATWEIPARSPTAWLYGTIPSSYSAIEAQFHHPAGTVTLADANWQKAQRGLEIEPFILTKSDGKNAKQAQKALAIPASPHVPAVASQRSGLLSYLTSPPEVGLEDEEQLLAWCVGIVGSARKHGYMSSTADSIAIYHTAKLLGQLRNRPHPSAYDFRDAAITCLEKDRTPKKRNIERLCEILLGGDRFGQVGYTSLPPLAQDVYDRLAPLNLNLQATALQRALLDFRAHPELLACSDLLWKLRYLLAERTVRVIMGERTLGHTPVQESWDIAIGKNQTPLIMLGYEGVTIEQVLEKRIKAKAFASEATAADALAMVEDTILYLKSIRLSEEIGEHAIRLLLEETGAQTAPEIFERVRKLVGYYRSTASGLPSWLKRFITTGYSHYSTLLPTAFSDRGTTPEQIAGMLSFLFTLESLALSLGCQRSQLLIAVQQAGPVTSDPPKLGLLWSAEWVLGLRTIDQIRIYFLDLLENPLAIGSYPGYVQGFLLALKFTSLVGRLVVELLSRAFERLPDRILLPWLPGLIMTLKPHMDTLMPVLLKEASACFPAKLKQLLNWQAPWDRAAPPKPAVSDSRPTFERTPEDAAIFGLLHAHPQSTNALAGLLGATVQWNLGGESAGESASTTVALTPEDQLVVTLLREMGTTANSLKMILPGSSTH